MEINKENFIEEEITFKELFSRFGIDDLDNPDVYSTENANYEIESWDEKTKSIVWKPIDALVVKNSVNEHYQIGSLKGTSTHRVLLDDKYVELKDHPSAILVAEPIQVLDISVPETKNYLAEGQINHNTTPGGMAIPYHASVRIKLTGGQQIKQTINGKEVVIGINVSAKTIKNKVARPWREVDFEIHFGRGIFESEQIFDTLREYCDKTTVPIVFNGMRISVEGTGAWKTFTVADNTTGEVVCEEKFYKSEFGEKILNNPKHKTYINALMDAVYIMNSGDENHTTFSGIDTSSNEEVQAAEIENNSDKNSIRLIFKVNIKVGILLLYDKEPAKN